MAVKPDRADDEKRRRIKTEELVVGYAMSRLDTAFLAARRVGKWKAAYAEASAAFSRPENSIKRLRDEFDPYFSNDRSGQRDRDMRPDRKRVMQDLEGVSDEALLELVDRILRHDDESTSEAINALSAEKSIAANVAEWLLTGRRAEEFFLENCGAIIAISRADILDVRNHVCGYDFGVRDTASLAIEVKVVQKLAGQILFTDREWTEAAVRGKSYILVVVGNLASSPIPRVIRDPNSSLSATCSYRTSIYAEWHAHVDVRLY